VGACVNLLVSDSKLRKGEKKLWAAEGARSRHGVRAKIEKGVKDSSVSKKESVAANVKGSDKRLVDTWGGEQGTEGEVDS